MGHRVYNRENLQRKRTVALLKHSGKCSTYAKQLIHCEHNSMRLPLQPVDQYGLRACACVCMQVVGTKHVLEEFRVGVTAVMLAAKQHISQGNLKHKDLTGQEVSSQVCTNPDGMMA